MTTNTVPPDSPAGPYTVIAVFSEEDILHKTFESLKDVNEFVKTNVVDKKHALVFVTEGNLVPESQWRQPDDENNKYWVVI
tara:strand:- start:528 stop:770 length:243 start_codon:yes stop_codon:yes gene_type:complete